MKTFSRIERHWLIFFFTHLVLVKILEAAMRVPPVDLCSGLWVSSFLNCTRESAATCQYHQLKGNNEFLEPSLQLLLQSNSTCVTTICDSVCLQKAIWLGYDLASNPVRYAPWACSLLSDVLLLKNNTDAGPCLTLWTLRSWAASSYFH